MKTFLTYVFSAIFAIALGLFSIMQYLELRETRVELVQTQEKLSAAREELLKASVVLNKNAVYLRACAEDLDDPYYAAKHWTQARYGDAVEITNSTIKTVGANLHETKEWLVVKTGIGDGK